MSVKPSFKASSASPSPTEEFMHEYARCNSSIVTVTNMKCRLSAGLKPDNIKAKIEPELNGGTILIDEDTTDPKSRKHRVSFPADRISHSQITIRYQPDDGYFYARFPHTQADIDRQTSLQLYLEPQSLYASDLTLHS